MELNVQTSQVVEVELNSIRTFSATCRRSIDLITLYCQAGNYRPERKQEAQQQRGWT